jgi:hypothetical protein
MIYNEVDVGLGEPVPKVFTSLASLSTSRLGLKSG